MLEFVIEIIQSIFLIIAAIIILITAYGILRLDDEMDKVIYVRIHMLGMVDIACILALIGLNQLLLAGIYFILAPFLAHALANSYYYGEDDRKYESPDELTGKVDDNKRNELATSKNISTTIDAVFKSVIAKDYDNNFSKSNNDNEYSKDGVVIKEVSTDDIENTSLTDRMNKISDAVKDLDSNLNDNSNEVEEDRKKENKRDKDD